MTARHTACGLLLALGLIAASCVPLPPPGAATPPPGSGRVMPVPRPNREPGTPITPPATPAPFRLDDEPEIDVGLLWDADTLTFAALRRPLTWRAGRPHDRAMGRAAQLRVTVTGAAAELRQDDDHSPVGHAAAGDTLWLGEPQGGSGPAEPQFSWNGRTWRGQAKVFVNARGRLTLALRLPLERYLLGVVPGEIGALSEALLEAGRAQAIAARSYTLYYRGRRGEEGFDVYGTVEDQVYGPIESERPLATRCVESTRGQLALYAGGPIRANYYSTCGGVTADAWEAFPASGFPYLKSQHDGDATGADYCARSPVYRWREEWEAGEFLGLVARWAPPEGIRIPAQGQGQLIDVRVSARSRSARVWRLEIESTTGTVTVPAYAVRRVLRRAGESHPILRSNLFKIDVRRDPATRRALAVVATGAGSGHGVGLCQTGALGMAQAGRSGEQILDHYYPGITLRRMY